MDFDTLQRRWDRLNETLGTRLEQQSQALRALSLQTVERAVRRRSWGLTAELIITIPVLLLLGSFLVATLDEPRFFVPALLLQLFAIVQLALHIHTLVILRSLDYSEPVVHIQKQLAALRVRWLRQLVWLYACLPLLWPPLLIVGMRGLLGLDAYALLGLTYLGANLLFGLACVPLVLWLARILAPRVAHVPLLQRLVDDLTGRSLREALDALDAAAAFEREPRAER
ncbi:MAG TPA: hypothetical protein PKD53_33710 [Chloroflexaceae bacterium]|nr:hypothetical protein [Chloroflexaceae bacterium]